MEKEKYNRERDLNKNIYGNRPISFYKIAETMLYSACCNPKMNNPKALVYSNSYPSKGIKEK